MSYNSEDYAYNSASIPNKAFQFTPNELFGYGGSSIFDSGRGTGINFQVPSSTGMSDASNFYNLPTNKPVSPIAPSPSVTNQYLPNNPSQSSPQQSQQPSQQVNNSFHSTDSQASLNSVSPSPAVANDIFRRHQMNTNSNPAFTNFLSLPMQNRQMNPNMMMDQSNSGYDALLRTR